MEIGWLGGSGEGKEGFGRRDSSGRGYKGKGRNGSLSGRGRGRRLWEKGMERVVRE